MLNLHVVTASVRPGRVGASVAEWFRGIAAADDRFETTQVDLLELDLPFMDEPNHPRLRQYTKDHTRRWSELVDSADAFAFVTPEYNYGMPPALLNAIDYLFEEWAKKPVGLVSYGGISAGTRSAQMTKQVVTTVGMVPTQGAVQIPFVANYLSDEGAFEADDHLARAASGLLDELAEWGEVLKAMRAATTRR